MQVYSGVRQVAVRKWFQEQSWRGYPQGGSDQQKTTSWSLDNWYKGIIIFGSKVDNITYDNNMRRY